MAEWIALARTRTITAKPKKIALNGSSMVAFRNKAGKVVVVPGRCAHRGMDLAQGRVVKDCLECPYHGWKYVEGAYQMPFTGTVRENPSPFHFAEQDGLLWGTLAHTDVGSPPPKLVTPGNDPYQTLWFETVIRQSAHVILENGIDPTHASWVHANPFGFGVYEQAPKQIRYTAEGMTFWYKPNPNTPLSRMLDIDNTYNIHAVALPYTSWSEVHIRSKILVTFVTLCPETPDRTRMFVGFARNFLTSPLFDPLIEGMGRGIVEQDRAILEKVDRVLNDKGHLDPEYDSLVASYRDGLSKCTFK